MGRDTLVVASRVTFLHAGFSAGPAVFTDAAGQVVEERRYEPFGAPIDARVQTATGYVVGAPDVVARDLNALNKRTEAATGWSDHGARWLASETGRWLTPDPPVEGPNASFMARPWGLNPYQYVNQNPVAYWDPDGREPAEVCYVSGWEPIAENGMATGPYLYGASRPNSEQNAGGLQFGAGLLNGSIGPGASASAVHVDVGVGKFVDSSGTVTYGFDAQAGLVHVNVAPVPGRPIGFDTGVANADYGAYASKSDATVSAEANLIDGALTVGSESNQVRGGFALGVGVAGRLHYGRAPDGYRAVGIGVDVTVGVGLELDIKTTLPSRIAEAVEDWFSSGISSLENVFSSNLR